MTKRKEPQTVTLPPIKRTVTVGQLAQGHVPLYTPTEGDLWLYANLFRTVAFDKEANVSVGPEAYGGIAAWHITPGNTDDVYDGWQIISNADNGYLDPAAVGEMFFRGLPIRAGANAAPLMAILSPADWDNPPTVGSVDIYLHIGRP